MENVNIAIRTLRSQEPKYSQNHCEVSVASPALSCEPHVSIIITTAKSGKNSPPFGGLAHGLEISHISVTGVGVRFDHGRSRAYCDLTPGNLGSTPSGKEIRLEGRDTHRE